MKKQVIILDFDGVVVNTEHLQLEYLNKKYGMNSKKEDYDPDLYLHENVNKLIGLDLSFEEFFEDFTKGYTMSKKIHDEAVPLRGAIKVISEAAKKYNFFISTMRNSLGSEVVKHVLHRHGILPYFKGSHFVYRFDEHRNFVKVSKADFISSFRGKVAFFVDDSHHEIEDAKEVVPSIWLNDSSHKKMNGIWRAKNWSEIGDLIL